MWLHYKKAELNTTTYEKVEQNEWLRFELNIRTNIRKYVCTRDAKEMGFILPLRNIFYGGRAKTACSRAILVERWRWKRLRRHKLVRLDLAELHHVDASIFIYNFTSAIHAHGRCTPKFGISVFIGETAEYTNVVRWRSIRERFGLSSIPQRQFSTRISIA